MKAGTAEATLAVLILDADAATHLAVAVRVYRTALAKRGAADPPDLAALEAAALRVLSSAQQASRGLTAGASVDDGLHDRDYLTRADVQRLTGASRATIDRWIKSGELRSSIHARTRRIRRADLESFHAT